jgi:hypothetical protein
LSIALKSLGTKVPLTIDTLCKKLHFSHETFEDITGLAVPVSKSKPVEVIVFAR